jgi:hypothetical protein
VSRPRRFDPLVHGRQTICGAQLGEDDGNLLPLWSLTEYGLTDDRQRAFTKVEPPPSSTDCENVGEFKDTERHDRLLCHFRRSQPPPRHIDYQEIGSGFVLQSGAGDRPEYNRLLRGENFRFTFGNAFAVRMNNSLWGRSHHCAYKLWRFTRAGYGVFTPSKAVIPADHRGSEAHSHVARAAWAVRRVSFEACKHPLGTVGSLFKQAITDFLDTPSWKDTKPSQATGSPF